MGVFIPLRHIPTPCNKNRIVLFSFELTPEMKTTKMSPVLESFPSSSWEHLCHKQSALVFMQQYHYFISGSMFFTISEVIYENS